VLAADHPATVKSGLWGIGEAQAAESRIQSNMILEIFLLLELFPRIGVFVSIRRKVSKIFSDG
jgi:hypothetical protein